MRFFCTVTGKENIKASLLKKRNCCFKFGLFLALDINKKLFCLSSASAMMAKSICVIYSHHIAARWSGRTGKACPLGGLFCFVVTRGFVICHHTGSLWSSQKGVNGRLLLLHHSDIRPLQAALGGLKLGTNTQHISGRLIVALCLRPSSAIWVPGIQFPSRVENRCCSQLFLLSLLCVSQIESGASTC